MFRNFNIGTRLTLLIILGVGLMLTVITIVDYTAARRMIQQELKEKASSLAQSTAGKMEVVKRAVEKIVQEVAIVIDNNDFSSDQAVNLLLNSVSAHSEVFGMVLAFGNGIGEDDTTPFIPYVFRGDETIEWADLAEAGDYSYWTYDWYNLPRDMSAPIWTDPYFDPESHQLMVTYSVPLTDPDSGLFRGVATGDVSLDWLIQLLAELELGESGYAFLLSSTGAIVAHPIQELVLAESIFSVAERFHDPRLREIGRDMISSGSGFVPFYSPFNKQDYWMAYTPVLGTEWSLAALFPRKVIMAKLFTFTKFKIILGLIGTLGLIVLSLLISRSISHPIQALDQAALQIASGKLDTEIPVIPGQDEVAHLGASFQAMKRDLILHIEELKTTTAERERIESDLRIARQIQLDLLPKSQEFTGPCSCFELSAFLEPAREVGGDFYDYFQFGDNLVYIALGDASGKGVPAALFVTVSRTFLRGMIRANPDPALAMTLLNDELSVGNETNMFLTLFCAVLNPETGVVQFANGGHNPTYLVDPVSGPSPFPKTQGCLVGPLEGMEFQRGQIQLKDGQVVFMYTDGVVEAMNTDQDLYGDDRLIEVLTRSKQKSPSEMVQDTLQSVRAFAGDAPQSDDITVCAFRWKDRTITRT